MIETYEEYIERLRKNEKLSKEVKELAVKRLTIMRNRAKDDHNNKKISFVKIKKNPNLYSMFEWSKTKEGAEFWKEIADQGF